MSSPATVSRRRFGVDFNSEIARSFFRSKLTVASALVLVMIVLAALLASVIAPQDPFDIAQLELLNSELPPSWYEEGDPRFLLGTDTQARDVFSSILYGSRVSLAVGFASVMLALVLGVGLGLLSGFLGGVVDAVVMRVADVFLSFPAILVALMVNGVLRAVLPKGQQEDLAIVVLILAIALTNWVSYARTVRGSTLVEKEKEYVQAARLLGLHPLAILTRHILPNVLGPVLVIATISLGMAVLTEATLSFLGVGMPPTEPSLGTLIRIGNEYLFSGIWWVVVFPSALLALIVLSVNVLGDWLRDVLNPKLR